MSYDIPFSDISLIAHAVFSISSYVLKGPGDILMHPLSYVPMALCAKGEQ